MKRIIHKLKAILSRDNLSNLQITIRNSSRFGEEKLKSLDLNKAFIAVKNVNWEKAGLVDSWNQVLPYVHWDWGNDYDQYSSDWHSHGKPAYNRELLERVHQAHKGGVDLFFSYLSGRWVYPETIEKIKDMGIYTINLGFDDRHSFWGQKESGQWTGTASIAACYDLNLTLQDPRDVQKYQRIGATALYTLPGGNEKAFYPVEALTKDIPVSFIGQPYGIRREFMDLLLQNGIEFQGFGKGWPSGMIESEEMLKIYSRSLITLGFGYVGSSRTETGLKGRDFEIPLTGCAYMTTYNQQLAACFKDGEEILFYHNKRDFIEKISYYLERPEALLEIGRRGRERALSSHLWSSRWSALLKRSSKP